MLLQIKCTDFNKYTFSSMSSNEKVYLFKWAPFNIDGTSVPVSKLEGGSTFGGTEILVF